MKNAYLSFLFIFIIGCQSGSKKADVVQPDEAVGVIAQDSVSEDEYIMSYDAVLVQFKEIYKNKVVIDTCAEINKDDIIKVHIEHYCLFDTILVPARYNWSDTPEDYIAHGFVSEVVMIRDGDTIVNTLVKKEMFDHLLHESLLEY